MVPKVEMTAEIRSILGYLTALHEGGEVAMILKDRTVFFAAKSKQTENLFDSPVVTLLQQLFDQYVDQSFFILRQRIFTNYRPYPRDVGMVKVVAKRISQLEVAPTLEKPQGFTWLQLEGNSFTGLSKENQLALSEISMLGCGPKELLWRLTQLVPRGEVPHDFDREIAAILVDENGKILSYGLNSNHLNKTLHAEVNMVQKFLRNYKKPLPLGSKIYVTHKPCKMCAAMIYDCSLERQNVFVFYGEQVSGRLSAATILDEMGLNQHDPLLLQLPNKY